MPSIEASVLDGRAGSEVRPTDGPGERAHSDRRARAALCAFVSAFIIAVPALYYFGRTRWFFYDEWSFLAARDLSADGLFTPHWQHWSTLPVLVYRALWHVVGLRSYTPYQGVAIALHLSVAVLLRFVMRRSGIDPWIATALATLFMFFGTGYANILWAFQMGFTGALAFGLTHLLLSDHNGPVNHKDWLGLAAGLAGLMCSGVAITMVVVVGLATLLRRGVRVALLHTVPLGAIYGLWLVAYGDRQGTAQPTARPTVPQFAEFVWEGLSAALVGLSRNIAVTCLLVLMLIVGLLLVWQDRERGASRRRTVAPLALLVGAFLFMALTAAARAGQYDASRARESRYLYVVVVLALPAIALAVDALTRRWRVLVPVMVALFVVSMAGNLGEFVDQRKLDLESHRATRQNILAAAHLPLARELPATRRPLGRGIPGTAVVTIEWLLDGAESGRIPRPNPRAVVARLTAGLYLALQPQPDRADANRTCTPLERPLELTLEESETFILQDRSYVFLLADDRESRPMVTSGTVIALSGPLALRIAALDRSAEFCGITEP